ncbi:MAG: DUF1559 family PulG-like putative transporter [Limisphaerales bacterium]
MIAIIAILAAMLLPALARAKSAARSAKCKSNLHQMAIALVCYLDDYKAYPLYSLARPSAPPLCWFDVLQPFSASRWPVNMPADWRQWVVQKSDSIFACPDFQGLYYFGYETGNIGFNTHFGSYGYNAYGLPGPLGNGEALSGVGELGLGGVYQLGSSYQVTPCAEGKVQSPADMIAIGDAVLFFFSGGSSSSLPRGIAPSRSYSGYSDQGPNVGALYSAGSSFRQKGAAEERRRHNGNSDVLSCDGHVEAIQRDRLLGTSDLTMLRRWSNDDLPHAEFVR